MTRSASDVRIRLPLLGRGCAVAAPALLLWLFVAGGAPHLTPYQWLGVLCVVWEAGRAFVVGIRATPDGDLVLRNHLHTIASAGRTCDSAMVAQSRRPLSFEWSAHLVLRDGTHHCVHATTVPSREWSDRRAQRQASRDQRLDLRGPTGAAVGPHGDSDVGRRRREIHRCRMIIA